MSALIEVRKVEDPNAVMVEAEIVTELESQDAGVDRAEEYCVLQPAAFVVDWNSS